MQAEIARSVRQQEALGLDVLVHGEAERNDMVEYFGEQLDGFAFTPIRLGAVLRLALREAADHFRRCRPPARPMTVELDRVRPVPHRKPMKGMLTGPVTILQLVVCARRPAALGHLPPDRARHAR